MRKEGGGEVDFFPDGGVGVMGEMYGRERESIGRRDDREGEKEKEREKWDRGER